MKKLGLFIKNKEVRDFISPPPTPSPGRGKGTWVGRSPIPNPFRNKKHFSLISLILLSLCILVFTTNPALAKKQETTELEIKSYDGFKLKGTLYVPGYASVLNKAPLVIFLHSICKSRIAWNDFPEEIRKSLNIATLNLDLRGHGKSIKNKKGGKLHWQNLTESDFQKMPEDVIEVIKYLEKQYPEVDTENVAIVGSSLGATVGLMAASYQAKDCIKTVIMFSPMLEYKGFDLRLPIVKYGQHPLLFIVSEKDRYPYESCTELIKFAQGKKLLKVYPNGGHGEDLLRFKPETRSIIINWIKDTIVQGRKIIKYEESQKKSEFKYKEVEEYPGKVKIRGDIYGGVH